MGKTDWGALLCAVFYSMACCYAVTLQEIENVTGKRINDVFIVGGGSKNVFLNKLTSNMTGKRVIACDSEATSLGNILTQIKYFNPGLSLSDIRKISAASIKINEYYPAKNNPALVRMYAGLAGSGSPRNADADCNTKEPSPCAAKEPSPCAACADWQKTK